MSGEFNALRKNQLLQFYAELRPILSASTPLTTTKFVYKMLVLLADLCEGQVPRLLLFASF